MLHYFDNISLETVSFSGANEKSLCNSCNSTGYSRSTSKKHPIGLLSLTYIISNLSIFFNHLNLQWGRYLFIDQPYKLFISRHDINVDGFLGS